MRIIQVGPYPVAPDCIRGGVESSVYGLTQEFVRRGHEVHVFDVPRLKGNETTEIEGILSIHRYINSGTHNEDAIRRIEVIVDDICAIHPDAIHIHGTGQFSASLYYELAQRNYKPLVTIHGLARIEKMNALKKAASGVRRKVCSVQAWKILVKAIYQYRTQNRVECQLLETIPKAIVDTGYLVDALKKYPVKRLPELHVIPQGANERFYSGERLSVMGDRAVLCVGTFSQRKSQTELIRAYEKLREVLNGSEDSKVKLVLCGVVSEKLYYQKVKATIDESPYKDDIVLKENLSQEELLNEYQKATVFALHSQEESQGIVLAEAMAMGLPVVSTRVGGIPYVVEEGVTGLLTEYGDVETTAKALEKILTNEKLCKQYAESARKAAEKYRWNNIANEILKCYEYKQ